MSFSHLISYGVSVNGTSPTTFNSSQTFDGQFALEVAVPAASTNFSIICPVDASQVKSVVMWASADCTVVCKASGGSTVNTFVFTADKPLIWQFGFPTSNPVTGDYATLEVTCTPAVLLTGYFGQDV
jgi:hypothetical protein